MTESFGQGSGRIRAWEIGSDIRGRSSWGNPREARRKFWGDFCFFHVFCRCFVALLNHKMYQIIKNKCIEKISVPDLQFRGTSGKLDFNFRGTYDPWNCGKFSSVSWDFQ